MHCPSHFEEHRADVLRALIHRHPLATVVTTSAAGLVADHIPLLVHGAPTRGSEPGCRLIGHVARGNPLWKTPEGQEVLLVFQGPSAYVSPNAYATKADGGRVVPTWNYAVVHAHATLRALHGPRDILAILEALTAVHEASQPHPWKVADAPPDHTAKLLTHIVGLELTVHRWQGKWKMSQNQPAVNQHSVVAALSQPGSSEAQNQVAQWVSQVNLQG